MPDYGPVLAGRPRAPLPAAAPAITTATTTETAAGGAAETAGGFDAVTLTAAGEWSPVSVDEVAATAMGWTVGW